MREASIYLGGNLPNKHSKDDSFRWRDGRLYHPPLPVLLSADRMCNHPDVVSRHFRRYVMSSKSNYNFAADLGIVSEVIVLLHSNLATSCTD